MTTIEDAITIKIKTVHEQRGKLAVIENNDIPFEIKRLYYLFDVPNDAYRGGHAHNIQNSFLIALSGSFEVHLDDGNAKKTIMLNKPNIGLFIPTGIWREIGNFSSGAACLVLASINFDETEYIRNYKKFLSFKNR